MASIAPDRPELAATQERVEALIRECDSLRAAMARGQAIRWLLFLGLLAFTLIFGYLFWEMAHRLQSEQFKSALLAKAQANMEAREKQYMIELQTLVTNTSPTVIDAFSRRANEDMPAFLQATQKEGEGLVDDLKVQVRSTVENHLMTTLDKYQAEMAEEIPALKDDQLRARLSTNLVHAAQKASEKYFINELETRVNSIYDTWDRFPVADPESTQGQRTADLIIGELFELTRQLMIDDNRVAGG